MHKKLTPYGRTKTVDGIIFTCGHPDHEPAYGRAASWDGGVRGGKIVEDTCFDEGSFYFWFANTRRKNFTEAARLSIAHKRRQYDAARETVAAYEAEARA